MSETEVKDLRALSRIYADLPPLAKQQLLIYGEGMACGIESFRRREAEQKEQSNCGRWKE